MSAPPASRASMRGTVASRVGKPAVKKVTKAAWSWAFLSAYTCLSCSAIVLDVDEERRDGMARIN